jgi:hypothetical protein
MWPRDLVVELIGDRLGMDGGTRRAGNLGKSFDKFHAPRGNST